MDNAAHHWGDHACGEAMERTLEREILAFLNTPKALASTVQAQYRDTNLSHRRWLNSSNHRPIHGSISFALEHILKALLRNLADKSKQSRQLPLPLDTLLSSSSALQIPSPKRIKTLSFSRGGSSPTH